MAKLSFTVENENGEKVLFEKEKLVARYYRNWLILDAELAEGDFDEREKLDKQLEFICSMFPKLTVDKMYDGMDMREINNLIADVFVEMIGSDTQKKDQE